MRKSTLGLAVVAFLMMRAGALAHDPGLSTATITLYTNHIEAVLGLSAIDAAQIVKTVSGQGDLVANKGSGNAALELGKAATNALEVRFDSEEAMVLKTGCELQNQSDAIISISFRTTPFTNLLIRSKWLTVLRANHRQLVTLEDASGQVLAERLLSARDDHITIELDQPLESPGRAEGSPSFAGFLAMGVKHIWTGYDHLLFLFGLLIVTRNFSSSVKIITCFTVAHSITLAVATLGLVNIPSRVVEPLIAVSIVYVGIENIIRADDPKGRGFLAFGFGLIHGFGFASVLRDLGVGARGSGIAVPLVSFNLGVELGQIAIAALALPMIWHLRKNPAFVKRWVPACSTVVAVLGTFWFVQRVWF